MLTEENKKILKEILSQNKNIVFIGLGTPELVFDSFGPLCVDMLKENSIFTCYGGTLNPLDRSTIPVEIPKILEKHKNDCLVVIDAAAYTKNDNKYKIGDFVIKKEGIKPAAFLSEEFNEVGDYCIKLISVTDDEKIGKIECINAVLEIINLVNKEGKINYDI